MDNGDLAAAAIKPNRIGPCNCKRTTKNGKPSRKCLKCAGTGKITACAECEASGWSSKQNKPCPKCQGLGHT